MTAREEGLSKLGFRFGTSGPHAARTMMLDDLRLLLAHTPADAIRADYAEQVVAHNVLGKPTRRARELALRHLATLYGLEPALPLFRAFRRLWARDEVAQPLLAVTMALARDPILRSTQQFIVDALPGTGVSRVVLEQQLAAQYPDRFSAASLKSFAQNVNGTWTAAGFLHGRVRKMRAVPAVTPANVALCLFLGHLEGHSGQRLFASSWMRLLGVAPSELEALASSALHRGLLVFMNAGGVKEVRFPGYLTPEEERIRLEVSHVV